MPKMMSMKDFLASGGPAVTAFRNKGVLPSYVAKDPKGIKMNQKPKKPPTPSFSRLNKGSKGKRTSNAISAGAGAMKKRATPMKKKKKMPTKKRTMPKY
jgi:hypothetical protein